MKKLINRVEDVLNEQLQGLAKAHPQLTLHQDPLYVTRTDAPVAGKVALLSGGGSGHEPMHCGYIGQGMLSGACPGKSSPRRRRTKCSNARCKLTAAKAFC
ncbi:phosphoenolpyruvate-dihydroxyacetone phosphotransferase [Klebsiella variicola]|nr:phosphoenolpyruvate-dihydroxyacetone phosphotransferase [Klebsiella variicola]